MNNMNNSTNNNNCNNNNNNERPLPIANVTRIMRKALPPNARISEEAKETMLQSVVEFINLITTEATEKSRRENRKSINAEDILWSMDYLGFEDYTGPLNLFLQCYRESTAGSSSSSSSKKALVDNTPMVNEAAPPNVSVLSALVKSTAFSADPCGSNGEIAMAHDVDEALVVPNCQPQIAAADVDAEKDGCNE